MCRMVQHSGKFVKQTGENNLPTPKAGYRLKSGKQIPGVTTILGRFKDSGGLLYWAFAQGKAGKLNLYDDRDKAADAGTVAHDMVFSDLHGENYARPDGTPDDIYAAGRNGFENYKKWQRQTRMFILPLEIQLVDEEFEFGGTPDAAFEIDGNLDVGDWKTSNGIYLDYIIQGAAYRRLWNVNKPDKVQMKGLHICRFSKEGGNFAHHYYDSDTLDLAWEQFKHFRAAYQLDQMLKKRL